MTVAIFIPVRLGSTRLPAKALLEIKGKPFLEHLVKRLKKAKKPDFIVICTTTNPSDRRLIDFAEKLNVECFLGSEQDILLRFLDAAKKFKVDVIVSVDGDDVFCDPEYIDKGLALMEETDADFVNCKELPLGASPNIFTFEALEKICRLKKTSNTETGWGQYFTSTNLFNIQNVQVEDELKHPEIRLTLDYPEDLQLITAIFDRLYSPGNYFTLKQIVKIIQEDPSLASINDNVKNKYWENFRNKSKIAL